MRSQLPATTTHAAGTWNPDALFLLFCKYMGPCYMAVSEWHIQSCILLLFCMCLMVHSDIKGTTFCCSRFSGHILVDTCLIVSVYCSSFQVSGRCPISRLLWCLIDIVFPHVQNEMCAFLSTQGTGIHIIWIPTLQMLLHNTKSHCLSSASGGAVAEKESSRQSS